MRPQTALQWFYRHAGYCQQSGENKQHARWRCARALAEAEAYATATGWCYFMEIDDDADASWMDEEEHRQHRAGELLLLQIALYRNEEHRDHRRAPLASIGNVSVYSQHDSYIRVCQAELAAEAMELAKPTARQVAL